ncbi:MAG: hypothetical protein Q4B77_01160 [Coriobacteriaceae bacterium]|nr:hypothetical protein [Coriobacteriaceae bacterium]
MSTRSAQNKRNQEKLQGTSRQGMARKSASSAKPARAAASSVRVVHTSGKAKRAEIERGEDLSNLSKEEKKARKAELRRQEDRVYTATNIVLKENEDYRRLRRIWWAFLIAGIVALVATWVLLAMFGQESVESGPMRTTQLVLIVAAYAFIIIGFIFDFVKIRPIRNEIRASVSSMSDARIDDILRREAEAARAKEAEKAASKKKK